MTEETRARFEEMAADERYSQITVRYAELDSSKFSVVFPDADHYFERARDLIHQAAGLVSYDEDATDHLAENARLLLQSAVADLNRHCDSRCCPTPKRVPSMGCADACTPGSTDYGKPNGTSDESQTTKKPHSFW